MAGKALLAQGTKRRTEILEFIRTYFRERGHSPTFQEIATGVNLSSPNAVRNHLKQLVDDGFVRVEPHTPRAISLVPGTRRRKVS